MPLHKRVSLLGSGTLSSTWGKASGCLLFTRQGSGPHPGRSFFALMADQTRPRRASLRGRSVLGDLASTKLAVELERVFEDLERGLAVLHAFDDDLFVLERFVVFEEPLNLEELMLG